MPYLNIDYFIVCVFLLITLVIGLRAGSGIKDIREYATANKIFGTGALVLTWLATDVAGETVLDMVSSVRTVGIIQPLIVFGGWGIALLMQALFFAPKFTRFSNCITMGDVMGQLYKGPSQVMTGLLGFFTALCIAGMELTVLGILCENLLAVDFRLGVGVGGFLLVLYTTHGGIKAVAFTDLFQGLILCIVVPIIMVAALKQAGGVQAVLTHVPSTQLQILEHSQGSYYLALFLSLSVFQFSVIDPALVQRILLGRTNQQLRHQFLIVATCLFALMFAMSLLGLASIVLYPEATYAPVVPRIVMDVLPIGLKGLAIAGLFAITMATFDSFLHAAGLTLVHDVINPLYKGHTFDELKWVRYVTSIIGLFVIGIGLIRADNLYNFVLLSYKFTGPLLAFPLFAGVCGLKSDPRSFYVASGATIFVLLLLERLCPASQNHWIPIVSVVTNGIVFFGMHAIRHNGIAIINRAQGQEYLWRPRRASMLTRLKQCLPTPKRLVQYSQRQVAHYGASYALFGIFCCVNYLFPYFMWEHTSPAMYDLMLYLRALGAMACGLLLVRDKWPNSLIPYLPSFWHLTLLYCLPFTSTVMFLITQGSVEWLINIAITIMFLIVLVDWVSFLLLSILGVTLGFLFYQLAIGPVRLQLDFSTGYLLVYICVFATSIALI
ncbi:MAG: sodium:solute symporter family protein, partial [Bacteroidota bacterium]